MASLPVRRERIMYTILTQWPFGFDKQKVERNLFCFYVKTMKNCIQQRQICLTSALVFDFLEAIFYELSTLQFE